MSILENLRHRIHKPLAAEEDFSANSDPHKLVLKPANLAGSLEYARQTALVVTDGALTGAFIPSFAGGMALLANGNGYVGGNLLLLAFAAVATGDFLKPKPDTTVGTYPRPSTKFSHAAAVLGAFGVCTYVAVDNFPTTQNGIGKYVLSGDSCPSDPTLVRYEPRENGNFAILLPDGCIPRLTRN